MEHAGVGVAPEVVLELVDGVDHVLVECSDFLVRLVQQAEDDPLPGGTVDRHASFSSASVCLPGSSFSRAASSRASHSGAGRACQPAAA